MSGTVSSGMERFVRRRWIPLGTGADVWILGVGQSRRAFARRRAREGLMPLRRALVLGLPFALALASDRVIGSVPPPLALRAAWLESQGEWGRAAAALGAEGGSDGNHVMARVRAAVRRGDDRAALSILDAATGQVPADGAALVRALLQLRAGDAVGSRATLAAQSPPPGLEPWADLISAEAAFAETRWDLVQQAAARAGSVQRPELERRWTLLRAGTAQALGDKSTFDRLVPDLGEAARRDDASGLLLWRLARTAAWRGDAATARTLALSLLEARPAPAESAYAYLERGPQLSTQLLPLARYEMRRDRHSAERASLS